MEVPGAAAARALHLLPTRRLLLEKWKLALAATWRSWNGSPILGSLPSTQFPLALADPSVLAWVRGLGLRRSVATSRAGAPRALARQVPEAGPMVAALCKTWGSLGVTAVRGCY